RTRRRRAARAWSHSRARRDSARSPPSRDARAAPGWNAGGWAGPSRAGRAPSSRGWHRRAWGAKASPVAHVVIAGAGPASESLAYLLARRGLGVTLLERQTDFAREFRGEGLMPSGVEALGAMGLGAALDALPQTRIEALDVFRGARRVLRVHPQDL